MKANRSSERVSRSLRRASSTGRSVRKSVALRSFLAHSASNKIAAIRTGFMPEELLAMAEKLQVPHAEIFSIVRLPPSTAARILREDRQLDQAVSERVARIAEIWNASVDLFGSEPDARTWLKAPNFALADDAPLQLLDTELGANEVRKVLAAIAHGGVV